MGTFWYEVGKGVFQAAGKKVEEAKKAEAAAKKAKQQAKKQASQKKMKDIGSAEDAVNRLRKNLGGKLP